jgi:hypothetical protein
VNGVLRALFSTAACIAAMVALTPVAVRSQTPADTSSAGSADTSASPADTTAKIVRKIVSSDGSIFVYEERYPGEGIEGFYWEFNKEEELSRLLDKDRRGQKLETIVDPFGFPLVVPDSIRALRDSVRTVADSILAVTFDLGHGFDPRFRTAYIEVKDDFQLNHGFETSYLLNPKASLNFNIDDQNQFNESTRKRRDDRTITSGFNYKFSEAMNSSITLTRADNRQERVANTPGARDSLESQMDNTGFTGRVQARRAANRFAGILLGDADGSFGITVSQRNYENRDARGKSNQLAPNWTFRLSRPHRDGKVALDYTGDYGRARSSEDRDVDSLGTVSSPETKDINFNNGVNVTWDQKYGAWADSRLTASTLRNQSNYFSRDDRFAGQQETRQQSGNSLKATINMTPRTGLTIRTNGDVSLNETTYDLEKEKFSNTLNGRADGEINYDSWEGGKFIVRLEQTYEDRDYVNTLAGQVKGRKASVDYKQKVTNHIDLDAGYFIKLDQYLFDDFEANKTDRDLLTERANFIVRYNPWALLSTSVRMEVRQTESVNFHPSKSPDNKTDEVYRIEPSYTVTFGKTNIAGDFTADATYSVFDFKEESNFLIRRFETRQKWQQAITPRLSTELIFTYELSDEGSYVRAPGSDHRLFSRSREKRRHMESFQVRYTPLPWAQMNMLYRQDSDETYNVRERVERLANERDVYELSGGFGVQKKITRHITFDLDYTRTQKRGDRISEVERSYYNVRASLEYQPFAKKPEKDGGG